MEHLTLKPRQAAQELPIESWDDDDLDIEGDDLAFRSASLATTVGSQHRESVSSRHSFRSDYDSNHGGDEKQFHLPGDDERATSDAIATATRAGIPIPHNVPSSALTGGTIKRLGGRKIKKFMQDDWDDGDLELPGDGGLKFKRQDGSTFPDALRQVSGPNSIQPSPIKGMQPPPRVDMSLRPELKAKPGSINLALERYRDASEKVELKPAKVSSSIHLDRYRDEDDDDFFDDGGATIKVPKSRTVPKILPMVTPPTPQKNRDPEDDFEQDLQLPNDGQPLRLSTRKDIPRTPISAQDEFDEWGEGSLGTRFGGTRLEGRSNRSSSSAMSPSATSSLTAESEDEGLDGLVFPNGPIPFDDILKKRQLSHSPDLHSSEKQAAKRVEVREDFFSGLEIGDGDVFDSKKLTFNRNIQMRAPRPASPVRPKTAVSLTFINKPVSNTASRLPRAIGHERIPSSLEPVSESGGPIPQRRSQSRMGGHSTHSSVTSVATPTSIHSMPPSTPRRRELPNKSSTNSLRNEPTTTNSQILKLKRSMPTMRTLPQSPAKPNTSRYDRPPSRNEAGSRLSRPKTPIERDRSGAQSSMSHAMRHPMPFLPAGAAQSQSHHIMNRPTRYARRTDSESSSNSLDLRPISRAVSRSLMRSPSPRRPKAAEVLVKEAATKRQLTKPVRRRHFGDGMELDGFDDLPTSRDSEKPFMKEPVGCGPPKQRSKLPPPSRTGTPAPATPLSPPKGHDMPRFARDTNASRMAREHVLAQRAPSAAGAPLATLTNQWKAKVSATTGFSSVSAHGTLRSKKPRSPQKPHLIKPLGNQNNPKAVKGMIYNPITFRWEGNDGELTPFDRLSSPTPTALPSHLIREKSGSPNRLQRENQNATPRPALITNINSLQAVQRIKNMVFDPVEMCWHKVPSTTSTRGKSDAGDTMDGFDALDDDEDVFKDVPDLVDSPSKQNEDSGRKSNGADADWLVGEEFDVGPEFIRRQRDEEDRWRKKCQSWLGAERNNDDQSWRWRIRDVISDVVDEL